MLINNPFAYCSNSPIIQVDNDGDIGGFAIGFMGAVSTFAKAVSSAVVATVASIVTFPVAVVVAGIGVVIGIAITVANIANAVQQYKARQRTAEQIASKSLAKSQAKTDREKSVMITGLQSLSALGMASRHIYQLLGLASNKR